MAYIATSNERSLVAPVQTDRPLRRTLLADRASYSLESTVIVNRANMRAFPPMSDRCFARFALINARCRAELKARGMPMRALRTGEGRDRA